jgi:hypothetical protein
MPETTQDYSNRLPGYVDGMDPLMIPQETPGKLARLIHGTPVQQLARRPEPCREWRASIRAGSHAKKIIVGAAGSSNPAIAAQILV